MPWKRHGAGKRSCQMANNEHIGKFNELVAESGAKQADPLMHRIKELVTKMRKELEDKIIYSPAIIQCPPKIAALFLMAEKASLFNDESTRDAKGCFEKNYADNIRNVQWTTEAPSQIEQNLWTLSVAREVFAVSSPKDYENVLSKYVGILEQHKYPLLCLMLWLFPQFVNEERMKIAKGIACESPTTSLLQDRMLYCLACIEGPSCSHEKASEIETQFLRYHLTIVEGGNEWGDIVSAAIGLLVLISCANQGLLEDSVIDATRKTVRWIVDRLTGREVTYESCIGWTFYALCKYIDMVRRLEQRMRV